MEFPHEELVDTPALRHILAPAGQKSTGKAPDKNPASWQTDGASEVGPLSRLASDLTKDAALGVPEEIVCEDEPTVQQPLGVARANVDVLDIHSREGHGAISAEQLAPLQRREHRRRRARNGNKRPAPRIALRKQAGLRSSTHQHSMPLVTPRARRQFHDHSRAVGEYESPAFDSPESPELSPPPYGRLDEYDKQTLPVELKSDADDTPPEEIVAKTDNPLRLPAIAPIPTKEIIGDENALAQADDKYIRHVAAVRRARRVVDVQTPQGYRDYRSRHPAGAQARGSDSLHTWLSGRGMSTSIAPLSAISFAKPKVRRRRDLESDFQQQVSRLETQMAQAPRCLAHKLMHQLSANRPKDEPYKYVFGVPNKYTPDIDASATQIQSVYRGHKARQSIRSYREGQAACHIQARARGMQTRRLRSKARREREANRAAYEAEVFAEVWSVLTYIKNRTAAGEDEEKTKILHAGMTKQVATEFSQLVLKHAVAKALEHSMESKRAMGKTTSTDSKTTTLRKAAGKRLRRASLTLMAALGRKKDEVRNEDEEGKGKAPEKQQPQQLEDDTNVSEQVKNDPAFAAMAAATVDSAQNSGKKAVRELKKRVRRASLVLLATTVGSKLNAVKSETVQQKAVELADLKKQQQVLENATIDASNGDVDSAALVVKTGPTASRSDASQREDSASSEEDAYDETPVRSQLESVARSKSQVELEQDSEPKPKPKPESAIGSDVLPQKDSSQSDEEADDDNTSQSIREASTIPAPLLIPKIDPELKCGKLEVGSSTPVAGTARMDADHGSLTRPLRLADGSLRGYKPDGRSLSLNAPATSAIDYAPHGTKARGTLMDELRSGELKASVLQAHEAATYAPETSDKTAEYVTEEKQQEMIHRVEEKKRVSAEEAEAAARVAAEHNDFLRRAGVPERGPGRSL